MKRTIAVSAAVLLFGTAAFVEAGWNSRSLRNLDVSVEYQRHTSQNSSGEPVFKIGNLLKYNIIIKNNGNRPFKKFPVQPSLHWANSTSCSRDWYDNKVVSFSAGQLLPGNSVSPVRQINIPKGGSAVISVTYGVPLESCPNKGELWLDQLRGGNGPSLRIPQKFEIVN